MALFAKLSGPFGQTWVELPYRDLAEAEAWVAGLCFGTSIERRDFRLSRHPTEHTISTTELSQLFNLGGE